MSEHKDLVWILNSGEPSETPRRDIMRVALVPFEPGVPVGVYFVGMHGIKDMKFVPRSAIPEAFRDKIELGDYIVYGNLMTKSTKDLVFTEFDVAPDPIELG
jgi:hypothetical protein